jgi:hypothetical protein
MNSEGFRPGLFKYLRIQLGVLLTYYASYTSWWNAWSAIAYDYRILEQLVKLTKLQQRLLQLDNFKVEIISSLCRFGA